MKLKDFDLKQLESWYSIQQTEIENRFRKRSVMSEIYRTIRVNVNITSTKQLRYMFYKVISNTNELKYLVRIHEYKRRLDNLDWKRSNIIESDMYDNLTDLLNSIWCQHSTKL